MDPSATPTPVDGDATWKDVAVTGGLYDAHVCAIRFDGTLWCWGSRQGGQLGDYAASEYQLTPKHWTRLSSSREGTCGLRSDQSLWCWGEGVDEPTQLGSSTEWTSLASGMGSNRCGMQGDGSVWCWGSYVLGDHNVHSSPLPRQVVEPAM